MTMRPPVTVSLARCQSYDRETVEAAVAVCLRPLGGMSAFVSPGQRVLLKPNFLSPKPPEAAVTTAWEELGRPTLEDILKERLA